MTQHLKIKVIFFLLLSAIPMQDCLSQVRLTRVNKPESIAGKKGIVYSLPRTVVVVDMRVTRIQKYPGPYAEYAKEMLDMDDVNKNLSTEFEIGDVNIHSYAEPDPQQVYLAEWDEKSNEELWLSITNSGLVLGSETFQKEPPVAGFEEWNEDLFTKFTTDQLFHYATEPNFYEKIDTIKRVVTVDTVIVEKLSYKHYIVPLSDKDKAQKAANVITTAKQDKYNLLSGYQEVPYTADALHYMVDQLDEIREENMKLFAGTTVRETLLFSFRFLPDSLSEGVAKPLAGFSKSKGITEAAAEHDLIEIIVKRSGITSQIGDDSGGKGQPGFIYRIPEPSKVTITYLGKSLADSEILINQYGVIRSLPANTTRLEFDTETGSVRKVVVR